MISKADKTFNQCSSRSVWLVQFINLSKLPSINSMERPMKSSPLRRVNSVESPQVAQILPKQHNNMKQAHIPIPLINSLNIRNGLSRVNHIYILPETANFTMICIQHRENFLMLKDCNVSERSNKRWKNVVKDCNVSERNNKRSKNVVHLSVRATKEQISEALVAHSR